MSRTPTRRGHRGNRGFDAITDTLEAARADYEADFGVVPSFWAGLHLGLVVVGEIGTVKQVQLRGIEYTVELFAVTRVRRSAGDRLIWRAGPLTVAMPATLPRGARHSGILERASMSIGVSHPPSPAR